MVSMPRCQMAVSVEGERGAPLGSNGSLALVTRSGSPRSPSSKIPPKVAYKKLMEIGESTSYGKWGPEGAAAEKQSSGAAAKEITFMDSAKAMAFTGQLNLLLFTTPFAIISYAAEWDDSATFILSLIALAPLAERLGYVTEQLAMHTNETVGGLLNATFGNATELIVAITALSRGLYRLVQLSLLGSILSNLLLVLGTALLFGGLRNEIQYFGTISAQINSTLLMLSTMTIIFPTILKQSGNTTKLSELGLSRAVSLILFLLYFAFLYFQLKSHKHLYDEPTTAPPTPHTSTKEVQGQGNPLHSAEGVAEGGDSKEEEEEEDEDELGFWNAIIWLGVITVFISVLSDALSASIQDAADSLNISGVFISAIVLPIVGNAAEHAGAVMFAWKGKVDLALGVAIGSSTQVALCVLPFLVILGWVIDKDLDLDFGSFESSTLFVSVVAVTFAIKDGKSNWLLGLTLMVAYLIIAVAFWAHTDEDLDS